MRKIKGLQSIQQIMKEYQLNDKAKYISREFQDYGYRLAQELNDGKYVSLYIKLAKETDRSLLEAAKIFVKGASNVKNKGRLFMWKLKQLKEEKEIKKEKKNKREEK